MTNVQTTFNQYDSNKALRHFLTIDGLEKSSLEEIFDIADSFAGVRDQTVKKVPLLRGKTLVMLFFEPSTRTRTTFEMAGKRLSADLVGLNLASSSTTKGETLLDTVRNIEAMDADMLIVRHQQSGAAHFIAQHVRDGVSVVNAGDGQHSHPTQAMLDMFTIRKEKGAFEPLKVAIVGDVLHSRVARSQILALKTLGVDEVRLIGPKTLIPEEFEDFGVKIHRNIKSGLNDIDVVMMLRLQHERMLSALLPSQKEYFDQYGLSAEKLRYAKPDAIVMHPGPINRGVEIASDVADGPQSVIMPQVTNGIAVRMAIISKVIGSGSKQ